MAVHRYQGLACWQLAVELKRRVYAFTGRMPAARDFSYCNQIRGSARSGTSNIAEGFGRYRPAEFARFLLIARASLVKTHNHLLDGLDQQYLNEAECQEICVFADRALRATTKLHAYLQRCKYQLPHGPT